MGHKSLNVQTELHAQYLELSKKTGHSIYFHVERALKNYLTDEAPQWIQAALRIVKK